MYPIFIWDEACTPHGTPTKQAHVRAPTENVRWHHLIYISSRVQRSNIFIDQLRFRYGVSLIRHATPMIAQSWWDNMAAWKRTQRPTRRLGKLQGVRWSGVRRYAYVFFHILLMILPVSLLFECTEVYRQMWQHDEKEKEDCVRPITMCTHGYHWPRCAPGYRWRLRDRL